MPNAVHIAALDVQIFLNCGMPMSRNNAKVSFGIGEQRAWLE